MAHAPEPDRPPGLLDLPPSILTLILEMVARGSPESVIDFGLASRGAHGISKDDAIWRGLCGGLFLEGPEAWRARSWKHLALGLALPYGALLEQPPGLWHSATGPSGHLLRVDAEPPRLVGRSLHFRTLGAGPHAHDIFAVELPAPDGDGPPAQALVTCWRDRHGPTEHERRARLQPSGAAGGSGGCGAADVAPRRRRIARPVDAGRGFQLLCSGHCNSVAVELTNRRVHARPYAELRQRYWARRGGDQQQQQQQQGQPAVAGCDGAERLPLPDAGEGPSVEFLHWAQLGDVLPDFHAPVFVPLRVSIWLHCAAAASSGLNGGGSSGGGGPSSAGAAAPHGAHALAPAGSGAGGDAQAGAAAALPLTGLWRGTYGSHGVEVVQLQLLLAPPGFDLFAGAAAGAGADIALGLAADDVAGHSPGVLLDGASLQGEGGAAAAADAAVAPESAAATTPQQEQRQQQQQVLLVATKVTGDTNVPVGQRSFVVHLGASSAHDAGQLLQLPPHLDSDVPLNRPGTRPLRVQARFRARAQIAFRSFQAPSIIAAELVTFDEEEGGVFGLIWKNPVCGFSLFTRAPLPMLPDAHALGS